MNAVKRPDLSELIASKVCRQAMGSDKSEFESGRACTDMKAQTARYRPVTQIENFSLVPAVAGYGRVMVSLMAVKSGKIPY